MTPPKPSNAPYLDAPVDIQKLIDALAFDDADIINAALHQPTLFEKAARFYIQRMKHYNAAKAKLDSLEADTATAFREESRNNGDKITETIVKEHVESHPAVKEQRERADRAEEKMEYGKLFVDALRMRRDAIRIITDVSGASGNSGNLNMHNTNLAAAKKKLNQKYSS